mmetsp:Transcript_2678/g.4196  ORF Transcript_2678/g.4196 Transcript_2678/m.4196 type:complete len:203 (+) Transcript_2678:302-910(+)
MYRPSSELATMKIVWSKLGSKKFGCLRKGLSNLKMVVTCSVSKLSSNKQSILAKMSVSFLTLPVNLKWKLRDTCLKMGRSFSTTLFSKLKVSLECLPRSLDASLSKMNSWLIFCSFLMRNLPLMTPRYCSWRSLTIAITWFGSRVSAFSKLIGTSLNGSKVMVSYIVMESIFDTRKVLIVANSRPMDPSRFSSFSGALKLCQ